MTEDELASLRRYKPAEVVQLLNIPAKRLAAWVRENRVPYQCAGADRGVWFTAADLKEIGSMLPQLMGGRRARHRAGTPEERQVDSGPPAPARPQSTAQLVAGWAQLRAHRPRPRGM